MWGGKATEMIHANNQGILEKDVTPETGWLRSKGNSYALARKVLLGKAGRAGTDGECKCRAGRLLSILPLTN